MKLIAVIGIVAVLTSSLDTSYFERETCVRSSDRYRQNQELRYDYFARTTSSIDSRLHEYNSQRCQVLSKPELPMSDTGNIISHSDNRPEISPSTRVSTVLITRV
ncbi:unnamed protein product [Lasius platythorax]|uniref:Uncharacterized protein n=1 Tax=Lasius platythorax TaxID=488582 RepID=A0AAV2NFZ0_9HYME